MQDKDTFSRQFSPLAAGYVPGGLHWAAAESGDAPQASAREHGCRRKAEGQQKSPPGPL